MLKKVMEEIYKDIKGYEGLYKISNFGKVKSLDRLVKTKGNGTRISKGRVLKNIINGDGYYQICLYKNGNQSIESIHRLVATYFIDNPKGYNVINHIDSDRGNNDLSNLEWCTQKQNLKHARDCGRLNNDSSRVKVQSYDPITGDTKYYNSVNSVKKYGFSPGLVCHCAKGVIKSKIHKGLIWDYSIDKEIDRNKEYL